MNYKTLNVPAELQEELLRLKENGKIKTISEFTAKSIKNSIKELKADSEIKKSSKEKDLEIINFKEFALEYFKRKKEDKLHNFLFLVLKNTTAFGYNSLNDFIKHFYRNAVKAAKHYEFDLYCGAETTMAIEIGYCRAEYIEKNLSKDEKFCFCSLECSRLLGAKWSGISES